MKDQTRDKIFRKFVARTYNKAKKVLPFQGNLFITMNRELHAVVADAVLEKVWNEKRTVERYLEGS